MTLNIEDFGGNAWTFFMILLKRFSSQKFWNDKERNDDRELIDKKLDENILENWSGVSEFPKTECLFLYCGGWNLQQLFMVVTVVATHSAQPDDKIFLLEI